MLKTLSILPILSLLLITGCMEKAADTPKKEAIKIGWLYSYTAIPHILKLARLGAELAAEEFNAQEGNARKVELLFRDDRGSAADGIQVARDLVEREGVDLLSGMSFTIVSKAVYEYAERREIPYFAGWCSGGVCKKKKGYTFSFEKSYTEIAHTLAAHAAKYPIKKWAIVRNQDTWSIAISQPFIERLKELRPDVELVAEITAPFGGIDGGVTAQLLKAKNTEGVYITSSGTDLSNYLRAQKSLGFLKKYKHIHPYLPPEEVKTLGSLPEGWYIGSYPGRELKTPENLAFIKTFRAKNGIEPGFAGALAYSVTKFMLSGVQHSLTEGGELDKEILLKKVGGLSVKTPLATLEINPETNFSNLDQWYGELKAVDGKLRLQNLKYGRE